MTIPFSSSSIGRQQEKHQLFGFETSPRVYVLASSTFDAQSAHHQVPAVSSINLLVSSGRHETPELFWSFKKTPFSGLALFIRCRWVDELVNLLGG
jgi:hypothetical protein